MVTIPLNQPIKMGGILYTESENILARIELDNGIVGLG